MHPLWILNSNFEPKRVMPESNGFHIIPKDPKLKLRTPRSYEHRYYCRPRRMSTSNVHDEFAFRRQRYPRTGAHKLSLSTRKLVTVLSIQHPVQY
ncbi:Protein of unknown function [Pyronema omphalodes CBS 100304]|uniref:Uncharacterized protein n=1 Tax=Pyronema omphalodes (strain CBS 100304) TaxID=1076935 RepID=U4LKU5_PYROM|nr:Protein of unknown function [Pyronema omphalodes CBS 100304]